MKKFLASVAAVGLMGGAAFAQGLVVVPQGDGAGEQQFILVPVPQDEAARQGAGQQQARQRAEAMALEHYRRGYQRGVTDARSRAGSQLDPSAMQQIGRELFERGYMLGLMEARAQMTAREMPEFEGQDETAATGGQQQDGQQQDGQQQDGQQASAAGQQGGAAMTGGETDQAGQQTQGQVTPEQIAQAAEGGQAAQGSAGTAEAGAAAGTAAGAESGTASGTTAGDASVAVAPTVDEPIAALRTTDSPDYGEYLTDAGGRAVYILEADQRGQGGAEAASNCQGECAEVWPPVLAGETPPEAEGDADSGMLSMTERPDGTAQVTYNGWPLYYYVKDQGRGAATGQDVHDEWGEWYLLRPDGETVED